MVNIENLKEAMDEMFDFICDMPSGLDGFESDFNAAFDELKKVESSLRWIPVSERLPEKHTRVLAYKKNPGGEWLFWAKFENNQWYDMEWNCWRYGITHWMPLPEPPEDDC